MEQGRIEGLMVRVSDLEETTDPMAFMGHPSEVSAENGVKEIPLERLANLPYVGNLVTIEDDLSNDQLFSGNERCPIHEGHHIRKNVVVQLNSLSSDGIPQSRHSLHLTRNRPNRITGMERKYFLPLNPTKASSTRWSRQLCPQIHDNDNKFSEFLFSPKIPTTSINPTLYISHHKYQRPLPIHLHNIIPTLPPCPSRRKRENPQIPLPHLPHILRLLIRRVPVSVTFVLEARCPGVHAVADEDEDDAAEDDEEDDYFAGEVGHCCSVGWEG